MKRGVSGKGAKAGLALTRSVCYIVLILLSLLCIFSFYFLIVNASRPHAEIMSELSLSPGKYLFKNLSNLLADKNISLLRGLFNSLFISACTAALTSYFSAMTAYGIYAYNFRFKKAAFTFIMMIMMVPTQVSAVGFIQLVSGMGLMDTFYPLILPSIAAPVVFYFMKSYMESVLPLEIVEAARVDGSNEFMTFNRIILPVIKPALAVQAIFSFVANWNNYFTPQLIINSDKNKTIPILIAQLRSADYMKFDLGMVYIMIFVAIIPLLIVYIFLSKYIIKGLTLGSVKG
ncbi:MAG: L-arabinose transport system permease protein AraQ [Firmicutes bacterium ADurb.Bin182]|nr:MAG: L-arabinose transport system permease protein AraQ [Firmicutes bacterium ADurb.Bin182]